MKQQTKTKLKHFFSAAAFLLIAALIYVSATYVFREGRGNQRLNILSFYNEPKDSLDMVIIGGSGIYRYFDPMYAYELSGLTSFDYACASFRGTFTINAIKEVLKKHNPSLILIDARRWLPSKADTPSERARYYLDSMDMNANRLDAALNYCRTYGLNFSKTVSLVLDLCLYHNNTYALFDQERWKLIDNRTDGPPKNFWKGFGMAATVRQIERPDNSVLQTTQRKELSEAAEKEYRRMLEYVSTLSQDVLIIVMPTSVKEGEMKAYNALEAIASEYGIPFWNGNLYYDEMALDFSTDFYNNHHTNVLGAHKFTKYLTEYIEEHYGITDHRNDAIGEIWNAELPQYHELIDAKFAKIDKKLASDE